MWVSEAIQDITQRVKEGQNAFTPTVVAGQYQYALPVDFGMVFSGFSNDVNQIVFDIVDYANIIPPSISNNTTVGRIAIYQNAGIWYIAFDAVPSGTEVIKYYTTYVLYSPSATPPQNWGNFSSGAFSGAIPVRDAFVPAIKEYMLGQLFDDRLQRYEQKVMKLKQNASTTIADTLSYNIG